MTLPLLGFLSPGRKRRRPVGSDAYLDSDRRVVGERVAELFRWIFLLILLVLNNFGGVRFAGAQLLANVVLLSWAAVNLAITILLLRGYQPSRTFGLSTMAVDILAGSALVFAANGLTSPFVLALFVAILASAIRFGTVYSLVAGLFISFLYLFVGGASSLVDEVSHPYLGLEAAGRVCLFLVVALVSGLMGDELIRERRTAIARAAESETLREMTSALAYGLDADDLFEVVLQQAVRITQADEASLFLIVDPGPRLVAYQGPDIAAARAQLERGDELVERARLTAMPIHQQNSEDPASAGRNRSVMVLPIVVQERVAGVLKLVTTGGGAFTARQFFMASSLAGSAAGPFSNALRLERRGREAFTDGLTGLLNRREFRRRLDTEMIRFERKGTPFGLVLIDIDNFKSVNDQMGHQHGDEILRKAASIVSDSIREGDLVARYGGDEIAVILPDARAAEAAAAADRIVKAVREAQVNATPKRQLTFSAGSASCPGDAFTATEALMAADHALYFAKRSGRDASAAASDLVNRYVGDIPALREDLSASGPQLIVILARVVDRLDPTTAGLSSRVAGLAEAVARRLGRSEGELELVRSAALLHDAGRLVGASAGEWDRQHPELSEAVVRDGNFLAELATVIRHHHEHWDGSGSPNGLRGDDIPILARVLHASGDYCRLSGATHGEANPVAIATLLQGSGSRYDPQVVDALVAAVR